MNSSGQRRTLPVLAIALIALLGACAGERRVPHATGGAGGAQPSAAGSGAGGSHAGSGGKDTSSAGRAGGAGASAADDAGPEPAAGSGGGGSGAAAAGAGAAAPDAGPRSGLDAVLCDGAPGITFAAVMFEGGFAVPGTLVMSENGYRYLLVEGTCRYWAAIGRLEHTVSGELSASELQQLRTDFQLERWQQLFGDYPGIGFDTPTYLFVLGRAKQTKPCMPAGGAGGCISIGNGNMAKENLSWLLTAFQKTSSQLHASGKMVSGDIHYLLVPGSSAIGDHLWGNPSRWPLGDASSVATAESVLNNGYMPGSSRLARGADADALREVWRAFLSYEKSGREPNMPASGSLAIPIDASGMRYQLFIRDSIPLEDSKGLIAY